MMRALAVTLLVVVAGVSPALATDIINQDQRAYKLVVLDGSVTSTYTVRAGSSQYGVCASGPCTFTIDGGSSITAGKDETLRISGGKVSKF